MSSFMTEHKPSIAMVGLGVMGSNLALNIESRGFACAVYNRNRQVTDEFMARHAGRRFLAASSAEELVEILGSPRQIFLMIKAGDPVDEMIGQLVPFLGKDDVLIDGGNSFFKDTQRRVELCRNAGVKLLGVGISGGEEGALRGPSIMPGGPREGWKVVSGLLSKIAAQVDGKPCTSYIGPGGSGHFVKMVHNGIEYGDMQLIAETYDILRRLLGLQAPDMADIFEKWNDSSLSSYLIEITAHILRRRNDSGEGYLIDRILDKAEQKGTGRWTIEAALELGVPIPTLAAAVDARLISSHKTQRESTALRFATPETPLKEKARREVIDAVRDALYCAKIMAYAQGMALLSRASQEWKWKLQLDEIAAIWKGGCIIRARFLEEIRRAFRSGETIENLMLDPIMSQYLVQSIKQLRRAVGLAVENGIPVPAFSASLAYFDSYRCTSLPQNLTQAQRDFFGAHTYERTDRLGTFHSDWKS